MVRLMSDGELRRLDERIGRHSKTPGVEFIGNGPAFASAVEILQRR